MCSKLRVHNLKDGKNSCTNFDVDACRCCCNSVYSEFCPTDCISLSFETIFFLFTEFTHIFFLTFLVSEMSHSANGKKSTHTTNWNCTTWSNKNAHWNATVQSKCKHHIANWIQNTVEKKHTQREIVNWAIDLIVTTHCSYIVIEMLDELANVRIFVWHQTIIVLTREK